MLFCSVPKRCKAIFLASFVFICCVVPVFAADSLVADNNVDSLIYAKYIGSGWIRGSVSGLGDVEIYFPYSSKSSWGLTSDSFLCNINSASVSGIMYDSSGRQYTVSCSGFSVPRYRLTDSSGYQYTDMYCSVYESNLGVSTSFKSFYDFDTAWPYIAIGLLGVIIVCLMRFKR